MIWKDQLGIICWHDQGPWNFQGKKYNILAFQQALDYVIRIRTDPVMSETKWSIIGTFFWASIILTDYSMLWSVTLPKLSVEAINKVMWLYLHLFDMLNLVNIFTSYHHHESHFYCTMLFSLLNEGCSLCQIQDRTGPGKSTVGRISKEVLGDKENCPRGCPSKLSSCDQHSIIQQISLGG